MSFTKFRNFLVIISSNIFSNHTRTLMTQMLDIFGIDPHTVRLWVFVFVFFQSFILCCWDWIISIDLSPSPLTFLLSPFSYWAHPSMFNLGYYIFQFKNPTLVLHYTLYSFPLYFPILFKSVYPQFLDHNYSRWFKACLINPACDTSALATVDYLSPYKLRLPSSFLRWGILSNINHCVMKLWFFKS